MKQLVYVCVCVCVLIFSFGPKKSFVRKVGPDKQIEQRRKEDGLDHPEKKETKELSKRVREKREEEVVSGNPTSTPISMAQERERERALCFSAFANTKGVEP